MRLHFSAAATALTLALSACVSSGGLHPQGTLTAADTLQARRSLADLDSSPAAWPAADWWTGLGDAQLSALIAEALHDNPDLAAVDARARAAQAQAGLADAARLPSVNAGASVAGARSIPNFISAPVRSSGMPAPSVRASNPRVSRSHAHHAKPHAIAQDAAYANAVTPAVLAKNQPTTAMAIHPSGWPIQKMYRVCRMILRPRVAPR